MHEHLLNAFLAHSIRYNYQDLKEGPHQFILETNDDMKFEVWVQLKTVDPQITYEILSWRIMQWNDTPSTTPPLTTMHADVCESPDCIKEAKHLWKDGPWFMLLCPTHFEQEEAKRLAKKQPKPSLR